MKTIFNFYVKLYTAVDTENGIRRVESKRRSILFAHLTFMVMTATALTGMIINLIFNIILGGGE